VGDPFCGEWPSFEASIDDCAIAVLDTTTLHIRTAVAIAASRVLIGHIFDLKNNLADGAGFELRGWNSIIFLQFPDSPADK
jgi:peptide methionine sulfoxide reductase MsrB